MKTWQFVLLVAVVSAAACSLFSFALSTRDGSDDRAMALARQLSSSDVGMRRSGAEPDPTRERLLFAIQAGLGGALLAAAWRGEQRRRSSHSAHPSQP